MDVVTLALTLLRRWYVVVPMLALTAGAVALLVHRAEPEYELRGSFLVSTEAFAGNGPPAEERPQGPAPGGISGALIAEAVQSGEVFARLAEEGATASYEVVVEGDLLRVTATDDDRDTVVPTVLGVLDLIEEEVEARQGAVGGPRVLTEVLAVPNDASVRELDLEGEEIGTGYRASGSIRLLSSSDQEGLNPYANAAFSLRILEEYLDGEEGVRRVVEAVHAAGDGGVDQLPAYAIEAQARDVAPIVYIAATGTSPRVVERTFQAIVEVGSDELLTRQERLGLAPQDLVSLQELAVPSTPRRLESDLQRPVITVVGLGLAAAAGLTLLVDSLLQGLAARRSTEAATEPEGDTAPAEGAPSQSGTGPPDVAPDESPENGSAEHDPDWNGTQAGVPLAGGGRWLPWKSS